MTAAWHGIKRRIGENENQAKIRKIMKAAMASAAAAYGEASKKIIENQ